MKLLKYVLSHPLGAVQLLYCYYLQNREFTKIDNNAENLIVFVVPEKNRISGGVMSIFSLATAAREIREVHGSEVIIVTYPGFRTYFKNKFFLSKETVYRFSQLSKFNNLKKIIVHVPELLSDRFHDSLTDEGKELFANIDEVSINILNQNIELMPDVEKIASLKKLSDRITQTTAHDSYCNQEICNKFQMPTHHFSVFIDLSVYPSFKFADREKVIVLSPDKRDCRNKVIQLLESRLPDYKLVTVKNMTFAEYMLLAAKSKFSLTFGEGFDGYLINAAVVNGLGFAVYNENFFPDESFLEMGNIYASYDDLLDNIVNDIRRLEADEDGYMKIIDENMEKINSLYGYDKFMDNQKRFYSKRFDYYPEAGG